MALALPLRSWIVRWRVVWVILLAVLMLSGCVQYDVGVTFDNPNRGEIVQHIHLEERLTSLSGTTAKTWLDSVEQRTRSLGGKVQRLSGQDLMVTIPFNRGADLEKKFNQFFSSETKQTKRGQAAIELPEIQSHLSLTQNNLILWQRNHLVYDLDLRSLGVLAADGNVLLSPSSLLKLEFRLATPWGARSMSQAPGTLKPNFRQQGKQLVWTLQPGQVHHLEAVFWLPSPLGIGTLVIVLLVLAGSYLKRILTTPAAPSASVLPEGS